MFKLDAASFRAAQAEREDNINLIAFEKDWYLVEVIKQLYATALPAGCRLIFNGGTSLSKRGLIARFSEDADFLLEVREGYPLNRKNLSNIRKALASSVDTNQVGCKVVKQEGADNGNQMMLYVSYPSAFVRNEDVISTRSEILIEIRQCACTDAVDHIELRSLVEETYGWPSQAVIPAIDPLVIAANKFVGLAWRVVKRDQEGNAEGDRNLVRHLHDLTALWPFIEMKQDAFRLLVEKTLNADEKTRFKRYNIDRVGLIDNAHRLVTSETPYHEEYDLFVSRMSFAVEEDVITYKRAIETYNSIVHLLRAS